MLLVVHFELVAIVSTFTCVLEERPEVVEPKDITLVLYCRTVIVPVEQVVEAVQ